jgi:hypothetical protein
VSTDVCTAALEICRQLPRNDQAQASIVGTGEAGQEIEGGTAAPIHSAESIGGFSTRVIY